MLRVEKQGGKLARGDHRLVMSAAILALNSKEGSSFPAEAVEILPPFIKDYQSLEGMRNITGNRLKISIFG